MTLTEAARILGCTTANLRMAIRNESLTAEKKSFGYLVEEAEVERYSRENLGRRGPKHKSKENL